MMRSNLIRILAATIVQAVLVVASASAQLTAAIEGIGSRISYEGSDGLSTVLIRPVLEWSTPSVSVDASGGFAQFEGGGWSLQGAASGSSFTRLISHFGGELATAAVGSTHQDGTTAGEVLGRGRLHWMGARSGAWVGGALGQAWNGVQWQADRKVEAGAWLRRLAVTLVAEAAPTWLGQDLQFLDAELTASVVSQRLDLTASGGIRQWSRPAGASGSSWGGASAALWFDPHIALVAAGGTYPTDYGQGLLAGTYFSLGVRLASRRSGRDSRPPIDARFPAALDGPKGRLEARPTVVSTFEVQPAGREQQTFVLRAPKAQRVDLIGDFTEWRPVSLTRASDGNWRVTLAVGPGMHRMNVRVNDGEWGIPPGLPALTDDFGGMVAVLQIPGP